MVCPNKVGRYPKAKINSVAKKYIPASPVLFPEEDRILGISLKSKAGPTYYIFCVYLPSSNLSRSLYKEYIDKLYSIYIEFSSMGIVLFTGDFNSEISGFRYRARSGSREQLLSDLLSMTGLYSPVSDVLCKGPSYTFDPYESGLNRSLIDHVLLDSS